MASATTSSPPSSTTSSCVTAVPGKNGYVPIDACNSNYNFDPQFVPAVAVAAIFGVLTLAHVVSAFAYKKAFAWVVIMGAAWETAAFGMHAAGALNQQNANLALGHQLLFLLAPLWVNAFAYMTFSRLAFSFLPRSDDSDAPKIGGIRTPLIGRIFVWSDVVVFLVQAAGGLMSNGDNSGTIVDMGLKVYMGGMGAQQAVILLFLGLMVRFQWRMTAIERADEERGDEEEEGVEDDDDDDDTEASGQVVHHRSLLGSGLSRPEKPWRGTLYGLYGALVAITVRIIYRMVEFSGGIEPETNPLPFDEAYSYGLDAGPMMAALLVLAIWHPGRSLQGQQTGFGPYRAGKKAQKKAAKREKKDAAREAKEQKKERKRAKKEKRQPYVDVELETRYEGVNSGHEGIDARRESEAPS